MELIFFASLVNGELTAEDRTPKTCGVWGFRVERPCCGKVMEKRLGSERRWRRIDDALKFERNWQGAEEGFGTVDPSVLYVSIHSSCKFFV